MLYPTTFFNRNPGLPIHNISVGFQPEIGSVGSPTYKGLLKFLSASDIESGYPRRGADTSTNEVWQFHKFQPWTTQCTDNPIYDHVYSYFKLDQSVSAKDWAAAAQLAAHVQYQALFNGFIRFMFTYTTAVLMWKSQSPWPSLRGFLYDWYLESTGTLRGVRAALLSPVSVVYDPQTSQLYLLNRQVISLHSNATRPIGARFSWIDIHGTTVLSGEVFSSMDSPAMSVSRIGHNDKDRLRWPKNCTAVCFMKLQLLDDGALDNQPTTWHWLTNPDLGEMSDFSELGNLRKRQDVAVELNVLSCVVEADGIRSNVTIYVHSNSSDVLFYPTFSIESVATGRQMLPLFDVDETDVVVTPGIGQQRQLRTLTKLDSGEFIRIVLTSWNAPEIIREVGCYAPLVEEL